MADTHNNAVSKRESSQLHLDPAFDQFTVHMLMQSEADQQGMARSSNKDLNKQSITLNFSNSVFILSQQHEPVMYHQTQDALMHGSPSSN